MKDWVFVILHQYSNGKRPSVRLQRAVLKIFRSAVGTNAADLHNFTPF
jgi:hypothetical protein